MKTCSVLSCPYGREGCDIPPDIIFQSFPSDSMLNGIWRAATKRQNFVPNYTSRICSLHFEDYWYFKCSGRLKKNAIPTLHLDNESYSQITADMQLKTLPDNHHLSPNDRLTSVSLIHGDTETDKNIPNIMQAINSHSIPRSLMLSQTTHKIVNIVSSTNQLFHNDLPESPNTIVLNYNQLANSGPTSYMPEQNRGLLPKFLNMQNVRMSSDNLSASASIDFPKQSMQNSQFSRNVEKNQSRCPIKVVDMDKLLEKPRDQIEWTPPIQQSLNKQAQKIQLKDAKKITTSQSLLMDSKASMVKLKPSPSSSRNVVLDERKEDDSSADNKVTVSHVLDCLRVILPRTFVLAHLKPNDKVASLVIRYLKLAHTKSLDFLVKLNLKVIINAAKIEEKKYGDLLRHPYRNISADSLTQAVNRVFPEDFNINNVSNEKLKCLCVLLNLDAFTDGFSILRKRLQTYSHEGQQSKLNKKKDVAMACSAAQQKSVNELTLVHQKAKPNLKRKQPGGMNAINSLQKKVIKNVEKDTNYPTGKHNKNNVDNNVGNTANSSNSENKVQPKASALTLVKKTVDITNKVSDKPQDKKAKLARNIKLVTGFLAWKKCSVNDILHNKRAQMELCKFLKIKKRSSNLGKLKKMLYFVIQKNLNKSNIKVINDTINKTIKGVADIKSVKQPEPRVNKSLVRSKAAPMKNVSVSQLESKVDQTILQNKEQLNNGSVTNLESKANKTILQGKAQLKNGSLKPESKVEKTLLKINEEMINRNVKQLESKVDKTILQSKQQLKNGSLKLESKVENNTLIQSKEQINNGNVMQLESKVKKTILLGKEQMNNRSLILESKVDDTLLQNKEQTNNGNLTQLESNVEKTILQKEEQLKNRSLKLESKVDKTVLLSSDEEDIASEKSQELKVDKTELQNREVKYKCRTPIRKKTEDKLRLKPVVALHNLADFPTHKLLFMGEHKPKANRYHNLTVPLCFSQIRSLQNYSSEQVRKFTKESYKEFRKIIIKRDGERVVFRLRYKRLDPGTSVFVKDFRYPLHGWFKGKVLNMSGLLRYTVELENGNTWNCVVEQMRPLPEDSGSTRMGRTQRHIKPKQLFDL